MNAKPLVLTNAQAKFLADLVEQPKVKDGKPEPTNTDLLRKMRKARQMLLDPVKMYLDAFDKIVETHNEQTQLPAYKGKKDALKDLLANTEKLLEQLSDDEGAESISYLVSETEVQFLIDRFDNREDLTPRGRKMIDLIVDISDALALAKDSDDIPVKPVEEPEPPKDRKSRSNAKLERST